MTYCEARKVAAEMTETTGNYWRVTCLRDDKNKLYWAVVEGVL